MKRPILATVIAGALLPGLAAAEPSPCAPRPEIVDQLAARYGERQVALGLVQQGQGMELWSSPAGDWTLLASLPSGISCVVATGERLELLPPPDAPANPA